MSCLLRCKKKLNTESDSKHDMSRLMQEGDQDFTCWGIYCDSNFLLRGVIECLKPFILAREKILRRLCSCKVRDILRVARMTSPLCALLSAAMKAEVSISLSSGIKVFLLT